MNLTQDKIEMLRNILQQYCEDCDGSDETKEAVDALFEDICKLNNWRSKAGDRLWVGLNGLSIKIKHEDEGVVIDIYDDLDAEAVGSTWVEWPITTCHEGLHSWTGQTGKLPAETTCDHCGETYGNPD